MVIPEKQHVAGKKYTLGIEQNNSNIRHFLPKEQRSFQSRRKCISYIAYLLVTQCITRLKGGGLDMRTKSPVKAKSYLKRG